MAPVRATPHAAAAAVELDACEKCHGLWIDGPELAAVCPTVAGLPERRLEIALLGRQGGGIARCPRCGQAPYEFTLLDIPVDFCAGCTGVWLDGDEYGEIPLEGAPAADAPAGGPYRAAAHDAARTGEVACATCGERSPLPETYMWELGLICRACYMARAQRAANRRAAESRPNGGLLGDLVGLLDALAPDLRHLQR
jgi:Zn-finger nucleic acid-binding protein